MMEPPPSAGAHFEATRFSPNRMAAAGAAIERQQASHPRAQAKRLECALSFDTKRNLYRRDRSGGQTMSIFSRLKALLSLRNFPLMLFLAVPLHGAAAVLGEPAGISPVGAPLRVEIAVLRGDPSRASECLRVAPPATDDTLPWVRDARITAAGRGATGRIIVESAMPTFEPILRLALENVCETRLRREFTLLLSFPDAARAVQPVAPTDGTSASTSETANTPRPRRILSPAVTTRDARGAPATVPRHATSSRGEKSTAAPAFGPSVTSDRLLLGGGESTSRDGLRLSTELASLDRIGSTSAAEREQLRRERNALMAVDRVIVAQLELADRIRQLEETQRGMIMRASLSADAVALIDGSPGTEESNSRDWLSVAAILAGLSLLLAAILIAMRRKPQGDVAIGSAIPSEAQASRPRRAEPGERRAPPGRDTALPPSLAAATPPDATADTTAAAIDRSAPGRLAPDLAEDEVAEEHESAIELADIMMGFGRVQGAAETLAEFIQSNPKKAVTPWLKLLEVYRAAGLRSDFDALARQLNKTFNVKSVTWETFDEARAANHSIEQMPHVAATLTQLWRTPACQAYLEQLLRDNRDGTREGFPLCVIDEILVLASILEDELGAYRSPDATTSAITV